MAESSKNPPPRHEDLSNGVTDRITNLPQSLLYHILSFLTTKDAAKTSVLSKQWQYRWTCVPVLDVKAKDMRTGDHSFEQVVYKVLLSMRELQCLGKISFSCDNQCDYVNLGYLLCGLVARDLQEFCLYIDHNLVAFELPRSLLSCKTLVVLKLKGPVAIRVSSSSVEFPKLEVLHLNNVTFKGDCSIPDLLLCCPVLRELVVSNISKNSGKLVVEYPALEHLTYHDSSPGATTVEYWDAVLQTIKYSCYARSLDLKLLVAMRQAAQPLAIHRTHSFDNFPECHNLVELKLEIDCYSVLGQLLYKLPLLKKLTVARVRSSHSCGVSGCRLSPSSPKVPNCLSSKLMTVTFQRFEGFDVEVECIGYIMKHSKVLQDVSLTTPSLDEKKMFPVLKKLMMFERASSQCRLNFMG